MLDYTTFNPECVDCYHNDRDVCVEDQQDCSYYCFAHLRNCIGACWWAWLDQTGCDNRCMWQHAPDCMKPYEDKKRTTLWPCLKDDKQVAHVVIDWGHKPGDAAWACNNWNSDDCGGSCSVKGSKWGCYAPRDSEFITDGTGLKMVETVEIWWGHTSGDAKWACNQWHSSKKCKNNKCKAYPVAQENRYDFRGSLPMV